MTKRKFAENVKLKVVAMNFILIRFENYFGSDSESDTVHVEMSDAIRILE